MFGLEDLESRVWSEAEVKLLTTAVPMFGTHWEREDGEGRSCFELRLPRPRPTNERTGQASVRP